MRGFSLLTSMTSPIAKTWIPFSRNRVIKLFELVVTISVFTVSDDYKSLPPVRDSSYCVLLHTRLRDRAHQLRLTVRPRF